MAIIIQPALRGIESNTATAAPNNVVPVNYLQAQGVPANIDVAIAPKGTGAILAQIPDNAVSGGNKRGARAVDWQRLRTTNTQVAAGATSVIAGGQSNFAGGANSSVGGGSGNTANSAGSAIAGGINNNDAGAGNQNVIAGGLANVIQAAGAPSYVAIGGGSGNDADASGQIFPGGFRGEGRSEPNKFAVGYNETGIDAQWGQSGGSNISINGAAQTLRADYSFNSGPLMRLDDLTAYSFSGLAVAANQAGGEMAAFRFEGLIRRDSGAASTVLVASAVTSLGADAGAATWTLVLSADTTTGGLIATFTGQAGKTINAHAIVTSCEVVH